MGSKLMRSGLCLLAALSLVLAAGCAAGETSEPAAMQRAETEKTPEAVKAPEPAASREPVAEPAPEPEPEPAVEAEIPAPESGQSAPDAEPQPVEATATPTLEDALAMVGHNVNDLYALIGMPDDSCYEYSCSGPGDDGILYYPGFLVFTYKENGTETVIDAEAEE